MSLLRKEQERLWAALNSCCPSGCFLRQSVDPSALWVSDFPRRGGDENAAREKLSLFGFRVLPTRQDGLWLLDESMESYRAIEDFLPFCVPALPDEEALLPVYALCRLLWLHPAPLERQPFELNRALWLWTEGRAAPRELRRVHESCAALLRQGLPLPSLGGRFLYQRLLPQN